MDHTQLMQASDIITAHLPLKHRLHPLFIMLLLMRIFIMIRLMKIYHDEDDGLLTHVSSIENHRLLN